MASSDRLITTARELARKVASLQFGPPVTHVYNPLVYAWEAHETYLRRYGAGAKQVLLVGMNPGPWGMAQTGVPFGEISLVRDWMGIQAPVGSPELPHPKRPVEGFACRRSEVSGQRLWGWARRVFLTPERFFERFFVANYCPLLFLEESGRNRTPDKLSRGERDRLFESCDAALRKTVETLEPQFVLGIGRFAEERVLQVCKGNPARLGMVPHPSPANPQANTGWGVLVEAILHDFGIRLPN